MIVLIQLRWENLTDVRLSLLMLRALWGMGKLDCVGILITLDRRSPITLALTLTLTLTLTLALALALTHTLTLTSYPSPLTSHLSPLTSHLSTLTLTLTQEKAASALARLAHGHEESSASIQQLGAIGPLVAALGGQCERVLGARHEL